MSKDVQLLTIAEFAAVIRCSERTVRRYIKRRVIPVIEIGRRKLVRRSDVEQFIAARERPALPQIVEEPSQRIPAKPSQKTKRLSTFVS